MKKIHLAILLTIILTSCSYFKAKEAEDSGFLTHTEKLTVARERFPFHKVWLKDYSEQSYLHYNKIIIRPVDITHLRETGWKKRLTLEGKKDFHNDIKEIAIYMQRAFEDAIKEDKENRFKIISDNPDEHTLILETALTELVPTSAWLNVAGNIAGFFLPGVATVAGIEGAGSVAIEGRFKDGRTGEVVAKFKDRESDQLSPIGIQDYTWYNHAKDNIDDWAKQIDEIMTTPKDHKVADSAPLTLRIW